MSLRLAENTIDRLGARARLAQMPPRTLAQRYVEEGLRMDEHPLIRFVDGPAGRRAAIVGTGLDVWEVIAVVKDNGGDPGVAADYLDLSAGVVEAAVAYYGAYRAEIDDWIATNEREAEDARHAWQSGRAAVQD